MGQAKGFDLMEEGVVRAAAAAARPTNECAQTRYTLCGSGMVSMRQTGQDGAPQLFHSSPDQTRSGAAVIVTRSSYPSSALRRYGGQRASQQLGAGSLARERAGDDELSCSPGVYSTSGRWLRFVSAQNVVHFLAGARWAGDHTRRCRGRSARKYVLRCVLRLFIDETCLSVCDGARRGRGRWSPCADSRRYEGLAERLHLPWSVVNCGIAASYEYLSTSVRL